MFERSERALKILCGVVAALVLYRLALALVHINPLYHVTIPQLPSLASAAGDTKTNVAGASATSSTAQGQAPGAAAVKPGTNEAKASTNFVSSSSNVVGHASNTVALATNKLAQSTNLLARSTNSVVEATNAVVQATNGPPAGTNANTGPNPPELAQMGGPPGRPRRMPPGAFPGMPPGGMPGMPSPGPALPPALQAR